MIEVGGQDGSVKAANSWVHTTRLHSADSKSVCPLDRVPSCLGYHLISLSLDCLVPLPLAGQSSVGPPASFAWLSVAATLAPFPGSSHTHLHPIFFVNPSLTSLVVMTFGISLFCAHGYTTWVCDDYRYSRCSYSSHFLSFCLIFRSLPLRSLPKPSSTIWPCSGPSVLSSWFLVCSPTELVGSQHSNTP